MMTMNDRDALRNLQDRFIDFVTQHHPEFPDNVPCFEDYDPSPTLNELRQCLYPNVEGAIKRYLSDRGL